MRGLQRFFSRLTALATRRRQETRLNQEFAEHIAMQTAQNLRAGLAPSEARRQAVLKFGAVEAIKEEYRDRRGLPFIEALLQDTRYALRHLRKTPAFSLTATLTLALGIGATTSIFTLVHAVMLKSLPVSNPDQLYRLGKADDHCCVWGGYTQGTEFAIVSYDLYKHFRDNAKSFAELAGFQAGSTYLGARRQKGQSVAETYMGEFVSGNYFHMFGLNAYAGRALTPADDKPGAPAAAVMSYRLWQDKYALDPTIIGGVFNLNNKPFSIVGIAPPGFYGDTLRSVPPDFYLPLATEPAVKGESSLLEKVDVHWLALIGRARSGSNPAAIEAQMRLELQHWLRSRASEMTADTRSQIPKQTLYLRPGGAGITSMRQDYEQWLRILMTVSGFVVLIVCANVANLMLVRGMERRQQTALSMALGAGPGRLVRQALTESILLSLLGGILGLAVAFVGTRLILHFAFHSMTAVPISAAPSVPVLLFAFAVSLLTGVIFGVAPAWVAMRANPVEALRGANRSTRNAHSLPRRLLVVVQGALCLVLLSASGLLIESLRNLEHQDFGFDSADRAVVYMDPVLAGYKPEQLDLLYRRIHDSFAKIPGVVSVASAIYTPFSGDNWSESVYVAGKPAPGPTADSGVKWDRVTAGYFDAIGNRILRGRAISDQDTAASRHVAVINEAFARKFFREEDPIGQHFGKAQMKYAGDYEIVGIAKDARYNAYALDQPIPAFFFAPSSQSTVYVQPVDISTETRSHYFHNIVVRMRRGSTLPEETARRILGSVDANLAVLRVENFEQQVAGKFSQQRLMARLTSLFGILALALASIGVYGVTAYNVGSRINEIGVRVALGAERGNIVALILRGASALIAAGLLAGVPLTLAAGRFLANQLYGVNQYDVSTIALASATLAVFAAIAAVIPAFRASSISPLKALKAE